MALGTKRVVEAAGAHTTSGWTSSFATVSLPNGFLALFLNLTVAANPGSLHVRPQWTDDNGTTWFDPDETFGLMYAGTRAIAKAFPVYSDKFRVAWDIVDSGSTSYTFGVNSFGALL